MSAGAGGSVPHAYLGWLVQRGPGRRFHATRHGHTVSARDWSTLRLVLERKATRA